MTINFLILQLIISLLFSFHTADKVFQQNSHAIPFKLIDNKVLVPVSIANSRTFDLILDSGFGFDGIILFKKDLADSIQLVNRYIVKIPGAGEGEPSDAIMSDSIKLISGNCEFNNQKVIILQGSNFDSAKSEGVIGYTLFGSHVVEVNYDESVLILHDSSEVIDASGWEPVPLTFNDKNWPYLNIGVSIKGEEPVTLNVYIDYASSLSLEFTIKPNMKMLQPDKYEKDWYGYGLSGDVKGKTAFISKFIIGKYEFTNATATFFEGSGRSKDSSADGVISNDALRRFNLVFDYPNKRLLIKPNNSFNEPFKIWW